MKFLFLLFYVVTLSHGLAHDTSGIRPYWYVLTVDLAEIVAGIGIFIYCFRLQTDLTGLLWRVLAPCVALGIMTDLAYGFFAGTVQERGNLLLAVITCLFLALPAIRVNYLVAYDKATN